jgi:hypothetical protein
LREAADCGAHAVVHNIGPENRALSMLVSNVFTLPGRNAFADAEERANALNPCPADVVGMAIASGLTQQ